MFRLLSFLLLLIVVATLCTWLLKNDGSVVVEWFGYRIQTSTSFAILTSSVMLLFMVGVGQFLIWVFNTPKRYKTKQKEKKRINGINTITEAFAAIAAGDSKKAKKLSKKATTYLGAIPLTHILSAQSAQLSGDSEGAKQHYNALMDNKETEIIALKGLLLQARKDNDINKAIFLAEKAITIKPDANWAILSLVELYKTSGQWDKASGEIKTAAKHKLISNDSADRTLALISLIKARSNIEAGRLLEATDNVKESLEYLPDFVPAIITKANLLALNNDNSRALKILSNSWKKTAHPDVINLYVQLISNEPVNKILGKISKLVAIHPYNQAAHLQAAKIAIKIDDLGSARDHLETAISINKTYNACLLMADLHRHLKSDPDIINEWLLTAETAIKDQCWHCTSCHSNLESWSSSCSSCHSFDSLIFGYPADISQNFNYKLNLAEIEYI